MCGIFGAIGEKLPTREATQAALRAIAHRGPDGSHILEMPGAVLGHNRLAI